MVDREAGRPQAEATDRLHGYSSARHVPQESWRQMRTLRWTGSVVVLCIAALAFAGCEGSVPKENAPKGPEIRQGKRKPRPAVAPRPGNIKEAVRRFGAAVESDDCEQVRVVAFFGPQQIEDKPCALLRQQLRGFEPTDVETYGTAAVVDYSAARGMGTVVFLTGRDGRFRWALRVIRQRGEKAVETTPVIKRKRLDAIAANATQALRQRECDRLAEAGEGILPLPKQPQQYCERANPLRKQLVQDAGARPNRLGANSRLAFYSLLPTPNGPYVTLVLLQEGRRAAFLSGFPVPAQRR